MAEEYRPYYLVDRITFGAAGTGTLSVLVGATEKFEGEEVYFVASSGTFAVEWMRDSDGTPYSNMDTSNPIPSAVFLTALDQRTTVGKFTVPLKLAPNTRFEAYVTGGTNTATLDMVIKGKMSPA